MGKIIDFPPDEDEIIEAKILQFPQTVEEDPNADFEFEIEAATDKQAIATAVRLLSTLYGSKVVVEK